jgi:hypothetical protein
MVFLLGCNHYLQYYDLMETEEQLKKLEFQTKESFYELLQEIIQRRKIIFVGEECWPQAKTIAGVLASELSCHYAEIDMMIVQRRRRGVPDKYQELGSEERARCFAIREDYMVKRTYEESTADTQKLIVCGAEHLNGLEVQFSSHGEDVTTRDLTKEEPFVAILKKKEILQDQRPPESVDPR